MLHIPHFNHNSNSSQMLLQQFYTFHVPHVNQIYTFFLKKPKVYIDV